MPVATAPTALITVFRFHAGLAQLEVVAHHARLRQRERREHADRVERDQGVGEPPNATSSRPADAESTRMPLENTSRSPAVGELAGQVAVAGDDRRQPGEVGVGGVGGQGEDGGGGELEDHVARARRRTPLGPAARAPSRRGSGTGGAGCASSDGAEEQRAEDERHRTRASWPRSSTPAGGTRARRCEIASTPVSATAPDEKPLRMRKSPSVPPASRAPSKRLRVERDLADVAEVAPDEADTRRARRA